MSKISIFLFLFFAINVSNGQNFQALPSPLNMAMSDETNPSLTGNGRTIVFDAPIGDNDRVVVAISNQVGGKWSRPVPVPGITTKADKIFNGAHFITFEGNFIFFSSNRYGGIGNKDLYFIEKTGNTWAQPVNLGKPINSTGDESDPTVSPDGRWLYFVRYSDTKTTTGKPCGKIYVAERKGKNAFSEPKALSSPINLGCECNPRVLADNATMTFASERPGGKGGYDQYMTEQLVPGQWTKPEPLSFINTKDDDLYISIPAGGDFLYLTGAGKSSIDLVRTIIPAKHRPKNVLILSGKVKDANPVNTDDKSYLNAKIGIQKVKKNSTNFIGTEEGGFVIFLPEKEEYYITFSTKGYSFNTLVYNLDTLQRFREVNTDIKLVPLKKDNVFLLHNDNLLDSTNKLTTKSNPILNNLVNLLNENPGISIEIGSFSDSIIIDSIPRPELFLSAADTTIGTDESAVFYKMLYHNDYTKNEARAILDYLTGKGISASRITAVGYGNTKPCNPGQQNGVKCTNRRLEVKVVDE